MARPSLNGLKGWSAHKIASDSNKESMPTKQELESSLHDAMRSGDEVRKRTLRMALTNIKLAEVDRGGPLDDAALVSLLQKEIKSRQESILDAQKAGRNDLIQSSQDEIAVLETYLPKQLTDEELRAQVQAAIDETGAKMPGEMGKVMKVLVPRLQGRANSDRVSKMVREMLQS